jgi:hypothetical protein
MERRFTKRRSIFLIKTVGIILRRRIACALKKIVNGEVNIFSLEDNHAGMRLFNRCVADGD